MAEPQGGSGPQRSVQGLSATTRIATDRGWRPAVDLRPGDTVPGAADAPQPVIAVYHTPADPELPALFWPVLVPAQAFGNPAAVRLQPGQPVMLDTDAGIELYGDPCPAVPALALTGWRGIARHHCLQPTVNLLFARAHVIYAGGGLILGFDGVSGAAPVLGLAQARHLVACIAAEEAGQALHRQAALRSANRA